MPIFNIVCPICTEIFNNVDNIHTTSCGHLFHFSCLNSWQTRERSCPQCRRRNPITHKIFLTFEELNENLETVEYIKLKLKSSKDRITDLREKKSEAESNLLRLQEEFTRTEERERELQETITQMKDMEDDFLHLQGQYTESSEALKLLEDRIQYLVIENECKTRELRNLEYKSFEVSGNSGYVVETLERDIKHVSEKLEKEICTSTQLLIEKMKLEGCINYLNVIKDVQKTVNRNEKGTNSAQTNKNVTKKSTGEKSSNQNKSVNGVAIKNIPVEQIVLPLQKLVINLASKMKIVVCPDDLIKVDWINDKKNCGNDYFMLNVFAQFKSPELMNMFLSNNNILKQDPTTKSIVICSYMSDQLHDIFLNAKEQLKNNGYDLIYKKKLRRRR